MARWTVQRSEPIRADAEGVFLGHDLLPGAASGDHVTIASGGEEWVGQVAEIVERADGRYLRLAPSGD